MNDVSKILSQIQQGDPAAADRLMPLVYDELRRLAASEIASEKPGQTLDATALVHEAYLRLVGDRQFADRRHFFRVAADAMRRILIDRARRKRRARHGGEGERIPIADAKIATQAPADELLALDEALDRLAAVEPVKAELVKLRYFAGLSEVEAAAALGISRATASRHWTYARAWLQSRMQDAGET
jgi:RNA polymerase sigma factor (TIGR02999 family)